MRSLFFISLFLVILCSCVENKQAKPDPYANLGDTVPAKEFEPTTIDTIRPDSVKDSIKTDTTNLKK